jgi:hypothetical protein
MAKSTSDAKRAIIAHLEQCGSATPAQLAEVLGGDWVTPPKKVALRKLLRRMVRQCLIVTASYGLYTVSPFCQDQWACGKDGTSASIEQFLRSRGGIASTKEIHKGLWDRKRRDLAGSYDQKRITVALTQSPLFEQHFGRGVWNLSAAELEKLPRIGRWASLDIKRNWDPDTAPFDHWFDQREDWFQRVGAAFAVARGDMSMAQVAYLPDIWNLLDQMAPVGSVARNNALDDLRTMIRAEGVPEGSALEIAVAQRREAELPVLLYDAFEAGSTNFHLKAPAEFYQVCAEVFGVCPAKLSRGVVERVKVEA